VNGLWLLSNFGDSGLLRHNCAYRTEGSTLEDPWSSMAKRTAFLPPGGSSPGIHQKCPRAGVIRPELYPEMSHLRVGYCWRTRERRKLRPAMASCKVHDYGNACAEGLAWKGGNRFANSIRWFSETGEENKKSACASQPPARALRRATIDRAARSGVEARRLVPSGDGACGVARRMEEKAVASSEPEGACMSSAEPM
jgi:hypothetical protein